MVRNICKVLQSIRLNYIFKVTTVAVPGRVVVHHVNFGHLSSIIFSCNALSSFPFHSERNYQRTVHLSCMTQYKPGAQSVSTRNVSLQVKVLRSGFLHAGTTYCRFHWGMSPHAILLPTIF